MMTKQRLQKIACSALTTVLLINPLIGMEKQVYDKNNPLKNIQNNIYRIDLDFKIPDTLDDIIKKQFNKDTFDNAYIESINQIKKSQKRTNNISVTSKIIGTITGLTSLGLGTTLLIKQKNPTALNKQINDALEKLPKGTIESLVGTSLFSWITTCFASNKEEELKVTQEIAHTLNILVHGKKDKKGDFINDETTKQPVEIGALVKYNIKDNEKMFVVIGTKDNEKIFTVKKWLSLLVSDPTKIYTTNEKERNTCKQEAGTKSQNIIKNLDDTTTNLINGAKKDEVEDIVNQIYNIYIDNITILEQLSDLEMKKEANEFAKKITAFKSAIEKGKIQYYTYLQTNNITDEKEQIFTIIEKRKEASDLQKEEELKKKNKEDKDKENKENKEIEENKKNLTNELIEKQKNVQQINTDFSFIKNKLDGLTEYDKNTFNELAGKFKIIGETYNKTKDDDIENLVTQAGSNIKDIYLLGYQINMITNNKDNLPLPQSNGVPSNQAVELSHKVSSLYEGYQQKKLNIVEFVQNALNAAININENIEKNIDTIIEAGIEQTQSGLNIYKNSDFKTEIEEQYIIEVQSLAYLNLALTALKNGTLLPSAEFYYNASENVKNFVQILIATKEKQQNKKINQGSAKKTNSENKIKPIAKEDLETITTFEKDFSLLSEQQLDSGKDVKLQGLINDIRTKRSKYQYNKGNATAAADYVKCITDYNEYITNKLEQEAKNQKKPKEKKKFLDKIVRFTRTLTTKGKTKNLQGKGLNKITDLIDTTEKEIINATSNEIQKERKNFSNGTQNIETVKENIEILQDLKQNLEQNNSDNKNDSSINDIKSIIDNAEKSFGDSLTKLIKKEENNNTESSSGNSIIKVNNNEKKNLFDSDEEKDDNFGKKIETNNEEVDPNSKSVDGKTLRRKLSKENFHNSLTKEEKEKLKLEEEAQKRNEEEEKEKILKELIKDLEENTNKATTDNFEKEIKQYMDDFKDSSINSNIKNEEKENNNN